MPLYEYECPECGRFEKIQKFSDRPLKKCPNGHAGVERLLSAPAIQFKGSGWYITDYARKSEAKGDGKADSKADGAPKSGDGGEKKASSDSKPSSSESSSSPKTKSTDKSAASSKRSP